MGPERTPDDFYYAACRSSFSNLCFSSRIFLLGWEINAQIYAVLSIHVITAASLFISAKLLKENPLFSTVSELKGVDPGPARHGTAVIL